MKFYPADNGLMVRVQRIEERLEAVEREIRGCYKEFKALQAQMLALRQMLEKKQ